MFCEIFVPRVWLGETPVMPLVMDVSCCGWLCEEGSKKLAVI